MTLRWMPLQNTSSPPRSSSTRVSWAAACRSAARSRRHCAGGHRAVVEVEAQHPDRPVAAVADLAGSRRLVRARATLRHAGQPAAEHRRGRAASAAAAACPARAAQVADPDRAVTGARPAPRRGGARATVPGRRPPRVELAADGRRTPTTAARPARCARPATRRRRGCGAGCAAVGSDQENARSAWRIGGRSRPGTSGARSPAARGRNAGSAALATTSWTSSTAASVTGPVVERALARRSAPAAGMSGSPRSGRRPSPRPPAAR